MINPDPDKAVTPPVLNLQALSDLIDKNTEDLNKHLREPQAETTTRFLRVLTRTRLELWREPLLAAWEAVTGEPWSGAAPDTEYANE